MISVHDDLLTVLDAVHIESRSSYRVLATTRVLSEVPDQSVTVATPNRLVEALAADIYSLLYCRPAPAELHPRLDAIVCRDHGISLAAANCGRGTWQAGWSVHQTEPDGRVGVRKGGVVFWARTHGVRPNEGKLVADGSCSVWIPHELRGLTPGFYMAIGDGHPDHEHLAIAEVPRVRFYWHLTPEGAAPFLAVTTSLLNSSRVPFEVKVPSDPNDYRRADAGVLYLQANDDSRIREILREIYSAVAARLRGSVPLFTLPIADGLSYAEDAAGPLSFGQRRCRLVAESLWESFEQRDVNRGDRARRLRTAFLARDLDPLRPYLEWGSDGGLPFGLRCDEFSLRFRRPTITRGISTDLVSRGDQSANSFLGAARRIGDALCGTAFWDTGGQLCNWMGRSIAETTTEAREQIRPTAMALGPDLYTGSAGVALYLAHLYAKTRDDQHRRTAIGATRRSLLQLERTTIAQRASPLSLFFGELGLADAARNVAFLIEEHALMEHTDQLCARLLEARKRPHNLDMLGGNAGAIPVLLDLGRATGSDCYRNLADELGAELCDAAIREGSSVRWDPNRASGAGIANRSLAGLSHGAAGIGLALLELYAASGRIEFRDTARGAFAFEDSLFDPSRGNWPDLRDPFVPNQFASAWCHGAPGIALSRLRAASLDPERADCYLDKALIALTTTLGTIESNLAAPANDTCLCHGLAGLGEVMWIAGHMLGDSMYRGKALSLAEVLIDRHGASGIWPSGVPSRGPNPSLMLGLAGVGYWFLRLHDPEGVPSVLLRTR